MEEMNLRNYAYLGDAVWELHIRKKTVHLTNNAKKLHGLTTEKVKGSFQAQLLNELEEILTEEEKEIARRGRNQSEYRQATAFETLIGWWYLNDIERYNFIINIIDNIKSE